MSGSSRRVLLVSDLYPPVSGGLEYHVDSLATELARTGHEVRVATLTPDPRPSSRRVRVHSLPSLSRRLPHVHADRPFHPPLPDLVARRALAKIIADFRPDVIHGHSWLTVSLPSTSVPIVFTAHDYGLVCQVRTLLQPGDATCDGPGLAKCISCGTHTYGRAKSTLLAPATISGRSRLSAQRILAVSSAVRDTLSPHVEMPIEVVPNFVGAEPDHEPLPDTIPAERFAVYAGDGRAYKGVPDLIEAWRDDPPLPLVLATPRPVAEMFPGGRVPEAVIPVSLTRGQMAALWQRATLAVVPSRWADPCPTVVMEALRAGVPVVGTRVGGIPELVRDGVEGVLVPPRDPAALAHAVRDLVGDPARLAQLSVAARGRAEGLTVAAVARRVAAVYGEMIAQPSPAAVGVAS